MKKLFAARTLVETAAITLLLVLTSTHAPAQSALDGFDPNANGTVRAIVVQPDGKILLGGDFTTLSPNGGPAVTRNHIARLNVDGTLDTAFNPDANFFVTTIAVQADGKVLVSGGFSTIGGQQRALFARLDAVTGLADSFNPMPSGGPIASIVVQSDGKILVGGSFGVIGGQPRRYIARLDSTTGLADSFNPDANASVHSIAVQADGKIVVGGNFTSIGGQTRNRIARLDAATGLADSFDPNVLTNTGVYALAVQADGKIIAGGEFTNVGGQTRNNIARLDAVTGLPDSFNPNASSVVLSLAVQPDGKILAGGWFNGANSIGGQTRNRFARLDPTTGLADAFDPNSSGFVYSIVVLPSGKILAGGEFTTFAPNGGGAVTRNRIARLEPDGTLDRTLTGGRNVTVTAVQPDGKILIGSYVPPTRLARRNADGTLDAAFNPNASNEVVAIAVQPDGKILVGGYFSNIGGQARDGIARLDATTGLADSFDAHSVNTVLAIVVQADGKILVGGAFTNIGGQTRRYIARLDPTTGLADSFNPNADGSVSSIAVQADGKILAAGNFRNIGGSPRNRVARLDPITGEADSFNPNVSNGTSTEVKTIVVQADGKILIGGDFTSVGGQTRNRIARLNAATGFVDSFNPSANYWVYSIALQADGKILAGGVFTNIGGQVRNGIARLDPATGMADSFNPNASDGVVSIALQADGKILVGGFFTTVGGQSRDGFARLSNDVAPRQGLAVTQSNITWARGGSAAQFTRVTFEYSNDNLSYTPLGDGVGAGSDWTLTSVSLPTGQNFYLRARGYYQTGRENASGSIQEMVRNVFLLGEVPVASVVSRKFHGSTAFDLNLPSTGNPGVECRSVGTGGDHQLIFVFANPLTSVGNASVTSGTGSVSSHMIDADAHNYIVNLTGVSDAQVITVGLTNVNDSAGNRSVSIPISMGVLVGDTNGDGFVNTGDALQTRNRSGQATDETNFRSDVNTDGFVNSGDTIAVRGHSGTSLP